MESFGIQDRQTSGATMMEKKHTHNFHASSLFIRCESATKSLQVSEVSRRESG